jgi:hypothetical protein
MTTKEKNIPQLAPKIEICIEILFTSLYLNYGSVKTLISIAVVFMFSSETCNYSRDRIVINPLTN